MRRVLILGDSIARGDGASQRELSFVVRWTGTLDVDIERYFFCQGGASSNTAREWAPYVWCDPQPHIVLVSYGMNDQTRKPRRFGPRGGPNVTPLRYRANMRAAVQVLRQRWPDVVIALVAPFDSHPDWAGTSGLAGEYRDALQIVGSEFGAALIDVTTAWESALADGASVDNLFQNRANHPSDAGHLIVAQSLIDARLGHSEPGDPGGTS